MHTYFQLNSKYRVDYVVKTTVQKNGEFIYHHEAKQYSFDSVSNDLNEIFTDLFDIHRFDSIVGIEILGVQRTVVSHQEAVTGL